MINCTIVALCLLTACTATAGIASAAESATAVPRVIAASRVPQPPTPVPQKKITQFANAYAEVARIQLAMAQQLSAATTPEQAGTLREDAEQQSRAAILRTGLALEEFDAIAKRAEVDSDLRQKITDKLEERSAV